MFGSQSQQQTITNANPFGAPSGSVAKNNPFAAPSSGAESTEKQSTTESLAQTFAQKASISLPEKAPAKEETLSEPWPEKSSFPQPYPTYFIDADKEYLDPEPSTVPQETRVSDIDLEGEGGASGSSVADDKTAFESSMDKAFQRFADRMAQNPEQVLRYEYAGQPLLYSKTDKIGKSWPRIPRCSKCGGERCFELQLTPHAIDELEAEDISVEGMDWGTVILATCKRDCEGWNEEWVGVQWEETIGKKPT